MHDEKTENFEKKGGGGVVEKWGEEETKSMPHAPVDFTPRNHIFSNCGGRRENYWGISCEKSRFYAKNHIFFQF